MQFLSDNSFHWMLNQNSEHQFDFLKGEVLLINKPYKWTSFNVISSIRYLIKHHTGIKKIKVGHAGTLDPLATGLLIICTGKFTKKIDEFQGLEKEYTGSFILGATTPSFDRETEIDQTFNISHINPEMLLQTAKKFTGTFEQIPPLYSAIKIDGKRAYKYARNKEDVKIKPKLITIKEFELTNINLPEIFFRVVCSKGTYIRSLASDFGEAIKCGAYLSSLKRIRIGNFRLEDAIQTEDLKKSLKIKKNYNNT